MASTSWSSWAVTSMRPTVLARGRSWAMRSMISSLSPICSTASEMVVIGGVGTLAVVAFWMKLFPPLRTVDRLTDVSPQSLFTSSS